MVEGGDEEDLVELAKARSGDAFLALVTRYKGIVASAVYTLIPDAREVEEVCEDAFAEAWRKLGELRAAAAFGGWVRKIARRLALRRLRARVRTRVAPRGYESAEDVPAGPGADPSEQFA